MYRHFQGLISNTWNTQGFTLGYRMAGLRPLRDGLSDKKGLKARDVIALAEGQYADKGSIKGSVPRIDNIGFR